MPPEVPLLEIKNMSISFPRYAKGFSRQNLDAVSSLDLTVYPGEIVAIAGASGSGKSLLAHAVLGLLPPGAQAGGEMYFMGKPLTPQEQKELRGHEIALVPQQVTCLDPLVKVGKQVLGTHRDPASKQRQQEAFRRLGLSPDTENLYPFQLSGGMARRVLFSTAVVQDARLILADEPTPGMEESQALEALEIFQEMAGQGKGVVLITHDIALAARFAHKIVVFYAGTTLEETPAKDFCGEEHALRHPYTKGLWQALPQNGFVPLPGNTPKAGETFSGCVFAPRCKQKTRVCESAPPPVRELRNGWVRCYHAE